MLASVRLTGPRSMLRGRTMSSAGLPLKLSPVLLDQTTSGENEKSTPDCLVAVLTNPSESPSDTNIRHPGWPFGPAQTAWSLISGSSTVPVSDTPTEAVEISIREVRALPSRYHGPGAAVATVRLVPIDGAPPIRFALSGNSANAITSSREAVTFQVRLKDSPRGSVFPAPPSRIGLPINPVG
jgi:hypothetical protein